MKKINQNLRFNLNPEKYERVILAMITIGEGEIKGKKKLAKLLYFYEFDFFEKNERQSIAETFQKYNMGPYPMNMDTMVKILVSKNKISKITTPNISGYNDTVVYKLKEMVEDFGLDKEELEILERIKSLYIGKTGTELENISHTEAPWNAVEMYQVIKPELSFYRCTDFDNVK